MRRSTFSAATAVVCAAALCVSARADPLDVVIELPGLGGGAFATAVSDVGYVAGGVEIPGCVHAALWRDGIPVELGVLGIPPSLLVASSAATDVNNLGDVVGNSMTGAPRPEFCCLTIHAFLWAEGVMHDLGVLGTSTLQLADGSVLFLDQSTATAVNDRRQVVGSSITSSGSQHAFLWQDGTMTDLGVLPGATFPSSIASDINNTGQIVGWSGGRAVIWEDGEIRALPRLDPSRPLGDQARAINDLGQVVGFGSTQGGVRGFFWDGKRLTELRPLPGDVRSQAFDLNNRGQVVGFSCCSASERLVLWEKGEAIAFPGLTGTPFVDETGGPTINNRGQIVGQSVDDETFAVHAYQIQTR
jgi:probable HAF family extracellular repeat protein